MAEDSDFPTTIEELLNRIEESRAAFDATIDRLTDEQLIAPLTERNWSVADHQIHIATWMNGITAALNRENRWKAMGLGDAPEGGDGDAQNEQLRTAQPVTTAAAARATLDDAHERLVARLRSMTFEDVTKPYRFYQPDDTRDDAGAPFLNWIAGDSFEHYDEHRGWIEEALHARRWA